MPRDPIVGAVVANELLDNLPFRLMQRTEAGWSEVFVAAGDDGSLTEQLGELPRDVADAVQSCAGEAPLGARVPWQEQAARWVADALRSLEGGLLLVFDYADSTPSLALRPQQEWVRTYRAHGRGRGPLDAPGTQDITVEVAQDQLAEPTSGSTQAEWLRANGVDALVSRARTRWHERASVGDLDAMRAASTIREAEALCDPAGLGAFTVLEWHVGG